MKRNKGQILDHIGRLCESDLGDDEFRIAVRELLNGKSESDPMKRVFKRYNELASEYGFPKAIKLTSERRTHLDARISEFGEEDVMDQLDRMVKSPDFNDGLMFSKWFTLDWFINANNLIKIKEGKYDRAYTTGSRNTEFADKGKQQVFI